VRPLPILSRCARGSAHRLRFVTRHAHTLVVDGPHRWIPHPFYDSAAFLILAVSLMPANWFFLAAGAVVFGLFIIRTRTEEDNLVSRFGDASDLCGSNGAIPAKAGSRPPR
jgi:protein-S-isoprenylcysteine O-methyltransferase Ste14